MPSKLVLPSKRDDLAVAIRRIREEAEQYLRTQRATWFVTYEYLHGNRDFDDINYRDGTVRVNRTDSTSLDFRYEMGVRKCSDEIGRLLRMDTLPKVSRRRTSLDHVRRASVAQLVLDNVVTREQAERLKMELIPLLVMYGTAGLVTWVEPTLPLREKLTAQDVSGDLPPPEIEVVPPWELMCVPANPRHSSQVTGTMRLRWVPLSWLDALGYGKEITANPQKVNIKTKKYGQDPTGSAGGGIIATLGEDRTERGTGQRHPMQGDTADYVHLCELWIEGRRGTLDRYVIYVDELILEDVDFTASPEHRADPPMMPISVARYIDVGGFYGRSLAELILPMAVRQEAALDRVFKNIEDISLFGTVMVPNSWGINPSMWEASDLPRFMGYEPDYTVPNTEAKQLQPMSLGAFPINVAKVGDALMDRLVPPSVLEDKGRVDSARGLGFLQELSTIPQTYPAMSIAQSYSVVYKAVLDRMRRLWPSRTVSAMNFLDDALAGIVLDPATGTLSNNNQIPKPVEVEVSIASPLPVSAEQSKRDLYDMKNGGMIDERWFRILSRKKGLDLPVAHEAEWENYRKAMLNNITLFGDGQTPGEGAMMSKYDLHDLHLEVMGAFMARPEFQLASVAVRERFQQAYDDRMRALGTLPEGMPSPDQMAQPGGRTSAPGAEAAPGMPT